jgi:PAS domain S-box-containing protein
METTIPDKKNLKENEISYRSLVENIPGIVYRLFAKGSRIQFFNHMLTNATGYEPDELEKTAVSPILSLIHPEDRARVIRTVRAAVREKAPFVVEYRMRTKNGLVRHFIERGRPVFDAEDKLEFIDGIINDISEQEPAEQDLGESNRALQTLIHNLPGMVFRCRNDWDWTMDFVSDGCTALTGYCRGDLTGNRTLSYGSLIIAEERQEVWNRVQAGIVSRKPFQVVYQIIDRTGHHRWVWEQGRGVFDATGSNLIECEGYIVDITSQKQAEDALARANKKLNILNSVTRHDILNQLTALKGFLELYHRECQGDARVQGYFNRLIGIAHVIGNQITFTGSYQELGVKNPTWQRVHDVATAAVHAGVSADIRFSVDAGPLVIFADPLLEKVFFNLYDNSTRHGSHVTAIRVSAVFPGGNCVIVVEDNGIGVPVSDKERIFKQDFGRNTGLGLFLSREILAMTGISIAEAGKYGSGARFEITVPMGGYRIEGDTAEDPAESLTTARE